MTPRVVSSNPFQRIEEEPPAPPRRLPSLKSPWPAISTGETGELPEWSLASSGPIA